MVNTKIRLIIFFAAKDGEALYSQQNKQTNKKTKGVQGRAELGVCTHIAMYKIDNQQGPTV